MKQVIVILGTILLGVWMVSSLVMGGETDTNSLQGQSKTVITKSKTQIESITK